MKVKENYKSRIAPPRTDLERWGEFKEMTYLHGIRDQKYSQTSHSKYKTRTDKRPVFKVGFMRCSVDKDLMRIFIGEAYKPLYKLYAKSRLEDNKKILTKFGFKNPGFPKNHSTPGDHYGTFSGKVEAFSPRTHPVAKKQGLDPPNVKIRPPKKGGPGYADILLSKYPEYMSDKYDTKDPPKKEIKDKKPFRGPDPPDLFDKNPYPEPPNLDPSKPIYKKLVEVKWTKSGRFVGISPNKEINQFPEYISSRYIDPWKIQRLNRLDKNKLKQNNIFYPPASHRTRPTFSVMGLNVDTKMNADNFDTMKPNTFTRVILS